jgi:anti-sigma factor RsiW
MSAHDELRLWLGSYVLGALNPDERAAMDEHVRICPPCCEELQRLAPVARMLGLIDPAPMAADEPSPALGERVLDDHAAAAQRRRRAARARLTDCRHGRARRWP